ncbi:UNVERIFIED_ORG: hypothetical protein [Escherichia phage CMSTMSU]
MSVVEKRLVLKNGKMTVKLYKDEADSFMAKAIEKSERYKILAPANRRMGLITLTVILLVWYVNMRHLYF